MLCDGETMIMNAQIRGMGIEYGTGARLLPDIDGPAFFNAMLAGLQTNAQEILRVSRITGRGKSFRDEVQRERTADLGDPRLSGWTFLVNRNDPQFFSIAETLRPLAEHRRMADPYKPLLFRGEPPDEWWNWLLENYSSLDGKRPPHYVLIVGGPDQVPFHFQSLLQSAAAVGRIAFDTIDDLKVYIEKVLRLERAATTVVDREVIVFAPDGGPMDPTHLSRQYMAKPLAEEIETRLGFKTQKMLGDAARKERLLDTLSVTRAAMVYTASHGLGLPGQPLEMQRRLQGSICCQRGNGDSDADWQLTADDIPDERPFLEGAVFFQFACYGYGTPAESDFMHWFGKSGINADTDFIAAIPKKLLANPRGPLAFIGHVDVAWLHGFADPETPYSIDRWNSRMEPFVYAVRTLLHVDPSGLAMTNMNKRYDILNAMLTDTMDRHQRGKLEVNTTFQSWLADTFITRSDAQNYMIFGDPAVRLRIPRP
jgi:hypothetical protein